MTEGTQHRLHCRVSEKEYILLREICSRAGFQSIYQLIQTLVRCFLRYANTGSYRKEETSLGREIEQMFDSCMDSPTHVRSYTTDHHSKIDY